jgi:hypothetical protein
VLHVGDSLSSLQIVNIILLGFWAPFTLVGSLYLAWRRIELRRRERLEFEAKMMDRDLARRAEFDTERVNSELRSSIEFLIKSVDSKMEDLGPRIRQAVEAPFESLRSEFSIMRLQIEAADRAPAMARSISSVSTTSDQCAPLIREGG